MKKITIGTAIYLAALLIFANFSLFASDINEILELKNGKTIIGVIIDITTDTLSLKAQDGSIITIHRKDLKSSEYNPEENVKLNNDEGSITSALPIVEKQEKEKDIEIKIRTVFKTEEERIAQLELAGNKSVSNFSTISEAGDAFVTARSFQLAGLLLTTCGSFFVSNPPVFASLEVIGLVCNIVSFVCDFDAANKLKSVR